MHDSIFCGAGVCCQLGWPMDNLSPMTTGEVCDLVVIRTYNQPQVLGGITHSGDCPPQQGFPMDVGKVLPGYTFASAAGRYYGEDCR
jgi:hypothetical protein